jgi:high-affinity iron transporter
MKFVFTIALGGVLLALPPRALIAAPSDAERDAQQLAALIDYVGGDYGGAVQHGVVLSASEYEEQIRMLADARALADRLVPLAETPNRPSATDAIHARLAGLDGLVGAHAEPAVVRTAASEARDEVIVRFHLKTTPSERPSLPQAEALYSQACAVCHGATGDSDTERARAFEPPPARFRDPARLSELSPYRVYNALTFGVPGTAMASFEALAPAERWSLAFYVFRLGHAGEPEHGPVSMTLADMAARSDGELLESLRADGQSDPAAALAHLRREAAFTEPPTGVGIDRTRRLIRSGVLAFGAGNTREADRLVLDAYLQGFEPLEARLRSHSPSATSAVENSFGDLRAAFAKGEKRRVETEAQRLDALLGEIAAAQTRPVVPFAAAALIFFREGLEAALLVGALLAGVRRLGRDDAARYVHIGWISALPAGIATWWAFDRLVSLGAHERELMEAAISLLAAAVLFSVSFWMISKVESRHWIAYLHRNLERSLSQRSLLLLAGLAFLAVYREAAESVLFTEALLLDSGGRSAGVLSGAIVGTLAVVALAWIMGRTVKRLPLGPFFGISSLLMCGLAIAFAGSGIHELVAGGHLAPWPVPFPEIPWMGIHPDLTSLLVQFAIVGAVAWAGIVTLWRRPGEHGSPRPTPGRP